MKAKSEILGIVRHVLTWAGGWLVSSGSISDANYTLFVGWVLAIVGIAWSITNKVKVKKLIDGYEVTIQKAMVETKVQGKVLNEN